MGARMAGRLVIPARIEGTFCRRYAPWEMKVIDGTALRDAALLSNPCKIYAAAGSVAYNTVGRAQEVTPPPAIAEIGMHAGVICVPPTQAPYTTTQYSTPYTESKHTRAFV